MAWSSKETAGIASVLAQLGLATRAIRDVAQVCRSREHVKSASTWCDVQLSRSESDNAAHPMFESIAEITADDQECFSWHLDIDALDDRIRAEAYVCRLEKHGQQKILDLGKFDIGNLDDLEQAVSGLSLKLERSAGTFDFGSGTPNVGSGA